MRRLRVVLADDHVMIAEAFETLLAPSCDVVAKVRTAARCSTPCGTCGPTSWSRTSGCRC